MWFYRISQKSQRLKVQSHSPQRIVHPPSQIQATTRTPLTPLRTQMRIQNQREVNPPLKKGAPRMPVWESTSCNKHVKLNWAHALGLFYSSAKTKAKKGGKDSKKNNKPHGGAEVAQEVRSCVGVCVQRQTAAACTAAAFYYWNTCWLRCDLR